MEITEEKEKEEKKINYDGIIRNEYEESKVKIIVFR